MNPLSYVLLTVQLLSAAPTATLQEERRTLQAERRTPQADRWLGEDKLKHLMMSTAVVGFAHAGSRTITESRAALTVAVVAGAAAGIWKELRDRRSGLPFSQRDLVWDAIGIGLGVALVSKAR